MSYLPLGYQVTQLPEDDIVSVTRQEMHARLVVAMGGRAAEELIFGNFFCSLLFY